MLSCVASQFQTMLHNRRGANVQQLSFLETSLSQRNDDVWATLDDEQRTLVLGILARLIARAIARPNRREHRRPRGGKP
jgi:hypothetical protein